MYVKLTVKVSGVGKFLCETVLRLCKITDVDTHVGLVVNSDCEVV